MLQHTAGCDTLQLCSCAYVQYEGVYADIDVWPLKPIDQLNADHGHDAALLLGIEFYPPDALAPTRPLQVTN
jgi:hypothetical protein